jgi:hypothetical protein
MTPQLSIDYEARLALIGDLHESPLLPGSWFITHRLGGPARNTYTEVAFDAPPPDPLIAQEIVRRVAIDLYGTSWAFHYRPDSFEDAIGRWDMRRRERVVVTRIEVFEQ